MTKKIEIYLYLFFYNVLNRNFCPPQEMFYLKKIKKV